MYTYIYTYLCGYIYSLSTHTRVRVCPRDRMPPCLDACMTHTCHNLPPSEIDLGLFCLLLQAQEGNIYFTELAERVEYGNDVTACPHDCMPTCQDRPACLHDCHVYVRVYTVAPWRLGNCVYGWVDVWMCGWMPGCMGACMGACMDA